MIFYGNGFMRVRLLNEMMIYLVSVKGGRLLVVRLLVFGWVILSVVLVIL